MKEKCPCAGRLEKIGDEIAKTQAKIDRVAKVCTYAPHIPYWRREAVSDFIYQTLFEIEKGLPEYCSCPARKKISIVADYRKFFELVKGHAGPAFNVMELFEKLKRVMKDTGASPKRHNASVRGRGGSPSRPVRSVSKDDPNNEIVQQLIEKLGPPDADKMMRDVLRKASPALRKIDKAFSPVGKEPDTTLYKLNCFD